MSDFKLSLCDLCSAPMAPNIWRTIATIYSRPQCSFLSKTGKSSYLLSEYNSVQIPKS